MSITREQLLHFYADLLQPESFQDYGPNGLQVAGAEQLHRLAFAVSATRDSIARASELKADALVVHHGLFWHFHGCRTVTGAFAKRLKPLIINEINLFAYHLPLDAHPVVGNAATLAKKIGLQQQCVFGDYKGMPTGVKGVLSQPQKAVEIKNHLEKILDHSVIVAFSDSQQLVSSIGIITGGANGDWYLAYKEGLDAYITGEISEHDWHDSQEHDVHMYAGGHHATERFGIQALMQETQAHFDIDCCFIDSLNPA